MSSHGVFSCCPSNEASGLSRASISVPLSVSMTTRSGSKIDRLSWPVKVMVTRSGPVSDVTTTFLRTSGLPFTYQIAPVIDAAASIVLTFCQRSRPPCALMARLSSSFMSSSFQYRELRGRRRARGLEDDVGHGAGVGDYGHVRRVRHHRDVASEFLTQFSDSDAITNIV